MTEMNAELRKMAREMLSNAKDKDFTDWELEFLGNMLKWKDYSDTQARKIEQIYQKKM